MDTRLHSSMLNFQLPIAGILATTAGVSLVLLYFSRPNVGNSTIQLPTHLGRDDSLFRDPFDVAQPEDMIDGYPINEGIFWDNVRLWKLLMCLLLAMVLVLQSISLGYTFVLDGKEGNDKLALVLLVTFALYSTLLSSRAIFENTARPHTILTIHLAVLTFVPTILFFTAAIFPSESARSASVPFLVILHHTTLVLYFLATCIILTIPTGPSLHFPPENFYFEKNMQGATNPDQNNVSGITGASVWSYLLFSYTTKVVMLGYTSKSLEIADLPIVPCDMRATYLYTAMRRAMCTVKWRLKLWKPRIGTGWHLLWQLTRVNLYPILALSLLSVISACLYYVPPWFLERVVRYLESDPERQDRSWGWFYAVGLFSSKAVSYFTTGHLWSLAVTTIKVRIRIQLNTVLFGKTLLRKDIASSSAIDRSQDAEKGKDEKDEDDFSSKAQVMTLMTTDVDRVSEFSWHLFSLIDSPVEVIVGTLFLYKLLGISCFTGLAVMCLFLPLNHYGVKVLVAAQEELMRSRDERVALMNEVLGAIRTLKFMAWERNFERKVLLIRDRELKSQKISYMVEVFFSAIWDGSPILVAIVAFWHFSVVRGYVLSPSIAFTSILVFNEMKFALNALPEALVDILQSFVSLRRIEKYLHGAEVAAVPPLSLQTQTIALQNATVTWPQDRIQNGSTTPSAASTPRNKFMLLDLVLTFPEGELSLVCGKLGSGKTLLLLALLGEADLLAGQIICPRSPPDALAVLSVQTAPPDQWVVKGLCAYVPQTAWLQNASIKENILFNLPYNEERYQKTLEVCALLSDLLILEDGDDSEIGERGVNLSGGQKARVSLARAVYSRASILLLDDVLSAVDAHTADHLYHQCLQGELIQGRTVILVSHHVQLCTSGASYVVALENGRVTFQGDRESFLASDISSRLVHSMEGDEDKDLPKEQKKMKKGKETAQKVASTLMPLDPCVSTTLGHLTDEVPGAETHVSEAAAIPLVAGGELKEKNNRTKTDEVQDAEAEVEGVATPTAETRGERRGREDKGEGDAEQGMSDLLMSEHTGSAVPVPLVGEAAGAGTVVVMDVATPFVQTGGEQGEQEKLIDVQGSGDREEREVSILVVSEPEGSPAPITSIDETLGVVEVEVPMGAATPSGETCLVSETSSTVYTPEELGRLNEDRIKERKTPRKLVEEEKRATGRISRDVWETYVRALGGWRFWSVFVLAAVLGALSPVVENWWLKTWSGSDPDVVARNGSSYYVSIYAVVTLVGLFLSVFRYYVLYTGSINASIVLYKELLEGVLFADIRFHDTVSRGRLLNRFGKDFEGIDSNMANNFGRCVFYSLAALTTAISINVVGGIPFISIGALLGYMYYSVAKVYGQIARDLRRLASVTRSPLYSIYGETIAGVTILRAFGASSKFLRNMIRCVDTNAIPTYWTWDANRWLSIRFDLLSSAVIGLTAFVAVLSPSISAALAGFALAFASSMTHNLLLLVRRFVSMEQSMVALERVKEYSELTPEPSEFIEPRPNPSWPANGHIKCEDLVVRYAPDLPDVLHQLSFEIIPGEKIGILGRTGSGKSTLALSFFRFVEATEGRIIIDGIDISKIGLTDLRSNLTIIPQDPTVLSGTLRSTLDVFDEYQDADIFEALRRVHLIPEEEDGPLEEDSATVNSNVFCNLDSPVSEGGENFSTGQKQLLCMARAILKRTKVLVMDEATASVDYATDELISKTIRQEFATSTILTIAHRLRTVIDYDRVMILDTGRIIEFDRPAKLLADSHSRFYAFCRATGKREFLRLKRMAGAV